MARYPSKLERAFDDSLDYERKLKKEIAELKTRIDHKDAVIAIVKRMGYESIVEFAEDELSKGYTNG